MDCFVGHSRDSVSFPLTFWLPCMYTGHLWNMQVMEEKKTQVFSLTNWHYYLHLSKLHQDILKWWKSCSCKCKNIKPSNQESNPKLPPISPHSRGDLWGSALKITTRLKHLSHQLAPISSSHPEMLSSSNLSSLQSFEKYVQRTIILKPRLKWLKTSTASIFWRGREISLKRKTTTLLE